MSVIPRRTKFPESKIEPERKEEQPKQPSMRERWKPRKTKKICPNWTLGPSLDRNKCEAKCPHFRDCLEAAAIRFLSVLDDMGNKLFDRLDERNPIPDGKEWEHAGIIGYLGGGLETIEDIQGRIIKSLNEWYNNLSDHSRAAKEIMLLRPSSRATLKAMFPDTPIFDEELKDKIHITDIQKTLNEEPGRLGFHTRIPHWFIDLKLRELRGSGAINALKVFLYLSRRATFDPSSVNHGKCWIDYQTIARRAGIGSTKGVQRGIAKLLDLGWIKLIQNKRRSNFAVVTTNCFVINFFGEWEALKKAIND